MSFCSLLKGRADLLSSTSSSSSRISPIGAFGALEARSKTSAMACCGRQRWHRRRQRYSLERIDTRRLPTRCGNRIFAGGPQKAGEEVIISSRVRHVCEFCFTAFQGDPFRPVARRDKLAPADQNLSSAQRGFLVRPRAALFSHNMPVNYGSRSDRIYAALNPKSGIRDEQKRAGVTPHDHSKDNRLRIKALQTLNKERAAAKAAAAEAAAVKKPSKYPGIGSIIAADLSKPTTPSSTPRATVVTAPPTLPAPSRRARPAASSPRGRRRRC